MPTSLHQRPKFLHEPASVAAFEPVSLAGLDKVKLMNRVDSKYVFHRKHLDEILTEVAPHYAVLEIAEKRLFDYASLYFDTPDYELYRHHHMGKPNRVKLRYREYIDTGDVFFEVKKKIKGMRTDKYRVREEAIINGFTAKGEGLMERLKVNALGIERDGLLPLGGGHFEKGSVEKAASIADECVERGLECEGGVDELCGSGWDR